MKYKLNGKNYIVCITKLRIIDCKLTNFKLSNLNYK